MRTHLVVTSGKTMTKKTECERIVDGVPDGEQVDCEREKVEVGEKQERDKHEETTNERSNM